MRASDRGTPSPTVSTGRSVVSIRLRTLRDVAKNIAVRHRKAEGSATFDESDDAVKIVIRECTQLMSDGLLSGHTSPMDFVAATAALVECPPALRASVSKSAALCQELGVEPERAFSTWMSTVLSSPTIADLPVILDFMYASPATIDARTTHYDDSAILSSPPAREELGSILMLIADCCIIVDPTNVPLDSSDRLTSGASFRGMPTPRSTPNVSPKPAPHVSVSESDTDDASDVASLPSPPLAPHRDPTSAAMRQMSGVRLRAHGKQTQGTQTFLRMDAVYDAERVSNILSSARLSRVRADGTTAIHDDVASQTDAPAPTLSFAQLVERELALQKAEDDLSRSTRELQRREALVAEQEGDVHDKLSKLTNILSGSLRICNDLFEDARRPTFAQKDVSSNRVMDRVTRLLACVAELEAEDAPGNKPPTAAETAKGSTTPATPSSLPTVSEYDSTPTSSSECFLGDSTTADSLLLLDDPQETTLKDQSGRCRCGRTIISLLARAPRRCTYDGRLYCHKCHRKSQSMIPSKVVKKWDFSCYPVSDYSLGVIQRKMHLPCIDLRECPLEVQSRRAVQRCVQLRQSLHLLADLLTDCQTAGSSTLSKAGTSTLSEISAAVPSGVYIFSFSDFTGLDSSNRDDGPLLFQLERTRDLAREHVLHCETCRETAQRRCPLCSSTSTIWAFDDSTASCSNCGKVFHSQCYSLMGCACKQAA